MVDFQNRASDIKLLKFHTNRDVVFTLKNVIFNESSFANSETVIRFVASKRVQG